MLKLIPTQEKIDTIIRYNNKLYLEHDIQIERFYLYRVSKQLININDYFIICHDNKFLPQIAKCFKKRNNCLYSDNLTCFSNYNMEEDIYFKIIETNNPYLQLPRIRNEYIEKFINDYEYNGMG